jgi:AraC-like DNA-binding protein
MNRRSSQPSRYLLVGIQFYPGVWQGKKEEFVDRYVGTPYLGNLPLLQTSKAMAELDFDRKLPILSDLVQWFIKEKLVVVNIVTEKILTHIDEIDTVADMARHAGLSPRQLQRTLKQMTGVSPHDLLKVLRVQQSLSGLRSSIAIV